MADAVVKVDPKATPAVPDPAVAVVLSDPAPDHLPEVPDGPMLPTFKVSYRDVSLDIQAIDETAARAMFNDRIQRWPSPRDVACVAAIPPA